jgi:DNA-binding MarR family transcriptional regulator
MQATTRPPAGSARRARAEAAVVEALYDIAVATRRLSRADRVDTGAVRLLWHLGQAGSCRLSTLALLAGLDLSTVSRHVRDLDAAGFVRRTPDPDDRRAIVLSLSAEGSAVLAEAQANRAAALRPVLATWSADDRADLTRLLTALAHDLTAAGHAACGRRTTDEDSA